MARSLAKEAAGARRVLPFRAALTLFGAIAVTVAYVLTRALGRSTESGSTVLWLASLAILLALSAWAHTLAEEQERARREARPRRLVVWLRRFHQSGNDRFPMTLLFSELSEWGVLACTLSDSTVARSDDAEAMVRRIASREVDAAHADAKLQAGRKARLPSFIVLLIGLPLCGVAALMGDRAFPIYGGWLALTVALTLVLTTVSLIRDAMFRQLYNIEAIEAEARQTADKLLTDATVVGGDRANSYFHRLTAELAAQQNALEQGFLVLRVQDADWQAVVAAALTSADAVLMDISHLSVNVEWEMQQLVERQGKIVFALGVASPRDAENAWKSHPSCQRLDTLLGAGWRERNQLFVYPDRVEPRKRLREASRFMPTFTAKIYEAMVG